MNDKNRQRHFAYEVLVILGQLALLTFITRLWPILLLVILGIFIAAIRLLFLSSQKVEPVKPLPALPSKWKDGEVCGLRVRGNKTVDIVWKNGEITKFKVNSL